MTSVEQNISNRIRDKLTEHKVKFIQVNPYIYECYLGLSSALSKLGNIIFRRILKNKIYETSKNRGNVNKEERRIYSNIDMKQEILMLTFNPRKYSNGKSTKNDYSNFRKKLRGLEKNNIFYTWDFKSEYIYVMEREIGSWLVYNPLGCVTPHTLLKIVCVAQDMMDAMERLKNEDYSKKNMDRRVIREEMEDSFGHFINKVKGKMNSMVVKKLSSWDVAAWKNIHKYLKELKKELAKLDPKEGLVEDSNFLSNLPPDVQEKLREEMKKEIEKMNDSKNNDVMEDNDLIDDLVPKNPNLVKPERKIHSKKTHKPTLENINGKEGIKAQLCSFDGDFNPFSDANMFTRYYRFLLKASNNKVQLNHFSSETEFAGQILDLMREKGKKDKKFLDAWILGYIKNSLRGKKIFSKQHTSLKSFKESFEKYERIYYVPK